MANNNSCNNFAPAKWIVNPTAGLGTHTTIGAAITAASSGDTIFVMPSTYTENLALKTGVNITAYTGDSLEPTVTIIGKCTYSSAGTVSISNIQLQTNSDYFLEITGSAASVVYLNNCFFNITNNTGIHFTSSSGSANIFAYECKGNITTTGISLYTSTASGNMSFLWCRIRNDGAASTASTNSASTMYFRWCDLYFPFSTSSTGNVDFEFCSLNSGGNTTLLTTAGTGSANSIIDCHISSGSASALSIGTGTTLQIVNSDVTSSNTNAITGAGTITINGIEYTGSSSTNNVTTQTYKPNQGYSNLQLISTQTASNSASIVFTGLTTLYQNYFLLYNNVTPVSNNVDLRLRISTDGGSTYATTNYSGGVNAWAFNSATWTNSNSSTYMYLLVNVINSKSYRGYCYLLDLVSATSFTQIGTTGEASQYLIQGTNTATSINALQITFASGNISTGTFSLYGIIQ